MLQSFEQFVVPKYDYFWPVQIFGIPVLSLLRTNQFVGNILLVFYFLLVRLVYFIYPPLTAKTYSAGVAWSFLEGRGWTEPGYLNMIVAAVATLVIAIGINLLENSHRLTGELNLIPGAMFILLASIFPAFSLLSPALLAVIPMVFILHELINLYKEPNPAKILFNIGFGLCIACLFYPSAIWFFFFILTGLNLMRAIRLNEILMILSGWITLFFIVGVYFYWQDSLGYYFQTQLGNCISWLDWKFDSGYFAPWIPLVVLLIIFLLGLSGFANFQLKKNIQAKKAISLVFFYLLFVGLTLLIQPSAGVEHLLLLFLGLGYLLTFLFLRTKSTWAESIHLLLIIGTIAYQLLI